MKTREKYLAIVFGVIVACWLGLDYFSKWFTEPLRLLQAQVDSERANSDKLHEQIMLSARKYAELSTWRKSSFPSDTRNAQRLYITWLTDLAMQSGFKNVVMSPEAISSALSGKAQIPIRIPVTIKAKTTLQGVTQFLERFESVDLLHRVSSIDLKSPSSEGNPELELTLKVEGLTVPGAADRPRLFSQTELFEPATKEKNTLVVVSNEGFPTTFPFLVRVGSEYMTVNQIDGNHWSVSRGTERSYAENHVAGNIVELFPTKEVKPVHAELEEMWASSLFTKPAPLIEYTPKLAATDAGPVIRGTTWTYKLNVTGWNPAFGTPKFEILSAPVGVEFDDSSTSLVWKDNTQAELGEHKIDLLVWGTNGRDSGFSPSLQARVRDPNIPPKFEEQGPFRFFVGRESSIQIRAEDPDANGKSVTYSVENGPAGLTIDAATGMIKWKPGDDMTPQKLDLQVKVTDSDEFPATATTTVSLNLEEDSARFTYLTARVIRTTGDKETVEAWIYDRASNHMTKLHKGDVFRVADFELELKEIGSTFVILKRGDQNFRWNFEQPLTDMQPVPQSAADAPPQNVS